MDSQALEQEIKHLIIDVLNLEDVTPDDIVRDEPLFSPDQGLGLDSIDALELGVALQETYNIKVDTDDAETRASFSSVLQLAAFVQRKQQQG